MTCIDTKRILRLRKQPIGKHPSAVAATSKEEDEDVDKWPVLDEMERSLSDSLWLRKERLDGGLRQIITNIDSSPNEWRKELLYKGMCDNSSFRNFIDQLLVTAVVLKKQKVDYWFWLSHALKLTNDTSCYTP